MGGGDCVRASEVIGAKRNSEEKAPEKHPKKRRFPVALRRGSRLSSPPFVSSTRTRARRRKTREMAGAAASSEPPASETPRDATGERAEPRDVAADSLPATATTPPRSAPPREPRVFLAPVEDAPHSEHAVSFLLDHLAREGDVVHLLVVVPATHPSSALAYGGPMVPRVAQPPRSCAKPSLVFFASARGAEPSERFVGTPHNANRRCVAR